MLYKSEPCSLRPKAREVLLTWARTRAHTDRASEYLTLAHLASDPNVRNRCIAIARHYCTLAKIERRATPETALLSHQSQSRTDRNPFRPFTSFAFFLLIVVSGAITTAPFDLGRASDCLAAPNSPAPKGSHWYYHLNRATQQKCWYVRSSEKHSQYATAQATPPAAAVPSTSNGETGSTTADASGPSRQVETSSKTIQDPASNTIPNKIGIADYSAREQ